MSFGYQTYFLSAENKISRINKPVYNKGETFRPIVVFRISCWTFGGILRPIFVSSLILTITVAYPLKYSNYLYLHNKENLRNELKFQF